MLCKGVMVCFPYFFPQADVMVCVVPRETFKCLDRRAREKAKTNTYVYVERKQVLAPG